jgi:hypothetical protein
VSEFPNPCAGGGVFADSGECVACGQTVPVAGGRWTDHSRPVAVELTGVGWCPCGCGGELTEPFWTPLGYFQVGHEPTPAQVDAELRAAGASDAAGDRFDTAQNDAAA